MKTYPGESSQEIKGKNEKNKEAPLEFQNETNELSRWLSGYGTGIACNNSFAKDAKQRNISKSLFATKSFIERTRSWCEYRRRDECQEFTKEREFSHTNLTLNDILCEHVL
ncbi:hypothetical protein CDAR_70661 [Caerostris darwini]|uniref:Uncharacterized protein n=1 Tax=Caerostris darwini TaxID=1538125 RepID=A0AAV4WGH9_9ARAC|nr:hypothetical protein CDAR_70661 [Caerostris darwini]